jgi:hypothetical protein
MANAWTGDYFNGHVARGAGNGFISCAGVENALNPNNTDIYFKSDTGDGLWAMEPVFVGTISSGKGCHTWYDGRYVWVTNGIDFIMRSTKYGVAGSWEVF